MQKLDVAARLFPDIVSGAKTSTIRWNEQAIEIGPLMFSNYEVPGQTIVVDVCDVTEMELSQVAAYLGKTREWPDSVLLAGMREDYPEIDLHSVVQVIEFERGR